MRAWMCRSARDRGGETNPGRGGTIRPKLGGTPGARPDDIADDRRGRTNLPAGSPPRRSLVVVASRSRLARHYSPHHLPHHGRALPGGGADPRRVPQLRRDGEPRAVLAMPLRALLLAKVPEGVLALPSRVVPSQRLRRPRREDPTQVRAVPPQARQTSSAERRYAPRPPPVPDPPRASPPRVATPVSREI